MSVSNPQNPLVERGKDGDIQAFRVRRFQYTVLGMLIIYRMIKNRDIKILITSSGNTTGTGKTTLSLMLSRTISKISAELFNQPWEWNANEKTFIDVWEYIDKYQNADPGDVLITDELEIMMDKRRSTTKRQVEFSQKWQKNRYKNVATIGTLPGLHSVDLRVRENSDVWINVIAQGRANVYYLTVNDFTGEFIPKRLKMFGYKESLLWLPIDPKEDPDMAYLDSLKEREDINPNQREGMLTKDDLNQLSKELREEFCLKLLELNEEYGFNWNQAKIASMIPTQNGEGMSQQWVSKVKKEKYESST